MKMMSTPLSWIQKKSSVKRASASSSSLADGTSIVSGIRLKARLIPEINWKIKVRTSTKPSIDTP